MWQYQPTDELIHYGKKGMRWGRRKSPEHKAFRAEVKNAKKHGMLADVISNDDYGHSKLLKKQQITRIPNSMAITQVKQVYNSKGLKIGKDEADKILKQVGREQSAIMAGGTAVALGVFTATMLLKG